MVSLIFTFLCVTCLIGVVRLEFDPVAHGEHHIRSCMRTHPIELDQLERIQYADFSDVATPEIQCTLHCFMTRSHFYDFNGNINAARAAKGLSYEYQRSYALQTMNVCKYMRGLNDCETSYLVYKCFKQSIDGHA